MSARHPFSCSGELPRTEKMLYDSRMDFSAKRASKVGSAEKSDTYHRLPKLPQRTPVSTVETICCPNFFQLRKKEGGVFSFFSLGVGARGV